MSLSNILEENSYDLFCNTINQSGKFRTSYIAGLYYFNQTDQLINNLTQTILTFDSNSPPYAGMPTPPFTYSNGVFTITNYCSITISVQVRWEVNTTGIRVVAVRKNANMYVDSQCIRPATSISGENRYTQTIAYTSMFPPGESFQIEVYQNSGSAINTYGTNSSPNYFTSVSITSVS